VGAGVIVSASGRAMVRELDGEAALLDLDSGMYYGLNGVATAVWNRMVAAGDVGLDRLVAEVVDEFAVEPEVARREVEAFIEALRASRLAHVR
jgi:hypothetical protein